MAPFCPVEPPSSTAVVLVDNSPMGMARQWDVYCKVIDNWGDLGVCWRLCADLGQRGEQVRLWVDQPQALAWMAPQGAAGVQVLPWDTHSAQRLASLSATDVLVEAFGCNLEEPLLRQLAPQHPHWINLEYLSAENYVLRQHGLPSPVLSGPGQGLTKHFFFPGFVAGTGGLLRETGLAERQHAFDRDEWRERWGGASAGTRLVSLFCYEPLALEPLLRQLVANPLPTTLLVTAGRATQAVRALRPRLPDVRDLQSGAWACQSLTVRELPLLDQTDYDHLLWSCDLNFVRGEDSLVRALWAGQPFVWNIYPQDDGAHHAKLRAFLDLMAAPASLRQAHLAWNGLGTEQWPTLDLPAWRAASVQARTDLLAQDDLVSQLFRFLRNKR